MKKMLFIAAAAALTFTACKKDDSVDNPGGETSKLLKKITKTEDDVTVVYNLVYDGNRRLTSITSSDNLEKTLISYDAAGNIVKVEETEADFKNIYTYTYANNIPVSATFKSWELTAGEPDDLIENDILTYTVQNDQVTNIHLEMTMHEEEADFKLSYTNGNLTKIETVDSDLYTATFVYGNKKILLNLP